MRPVPAPRTSLLAKAENTVLAAALCGIVVVVLLQIGSRALLDRPLSWSTEAATDFLVWSAFLGFAVGVRERGHVALTLIEEHLSGRVLYAVRLAQLTVFAFLLGGLCYGGAQMVFGELDAVSPAGIPRWTVFAAVPVGTGLALLHVAVQAFTLSPDDAADAPGTAGRAAADPIEAAGGTL
ncbi:TRAP transporter small permease [Actinomadura darangshiensis]|uniref:TRAP transporter small permease n=1 Tax=Actinomadura darangshiensis TaxID=705336 RepID=A0A4V2YVU9_9ACTN|nr:TRAP transporter small permease [Actinomadura darangshiensis]TDD83047.1 TRAP transporter small permease [Actinomadura darangshiensis]